MVAPWYKLFTQQDEGKWVLEDYLLPTESGCGGRTEVSGGVQWHVRSWGWNS